MSKDGTTVTIEIPRELLQDVCELIAEAYKDAQAKINRQARIIDDLLYEQNERKNKLEFLSEENRNLRKILEGKGDEF